MRESGRTGNHAQGSIIQRTNNDRSARRASNVRLVKGEELRVGVVLLIGLITEIQKTWKSWNVGRRPTSVSRKRL